MDRLDLGSAAPANWASSQAAAELYRIHQGIEYSGLQATSDTPALLYRVHQAREYSGDLTSDTAAGLWQQFLREHHAEMTAP